MSSENFEVGKFDGLNSFGMWQCILKNVLCQHELKAAIKEQKPRDMRNVIWEKINQQACGIILSCPTWDKRYPYIKKMST